MAEFCQACVRRFDWQCVHMLTPSHQDIVVRMQNKDMINEMIQNRNCVNKERTWWQQREQAHANCILQVCKCVWAVLRCFLSVYPIGVNPLLQGERYAEQSLLVLLNLHLLQALSLHLLQGLAEWDTRLAESSQTPIYNMQSIILVSNAISTGIPSTCPFT